MIVQWCSSPPITLEIRKLWKGAKKQESLLSEHYGTSYVLISSLGHSGSSNRSTSEIFSFLCADIIREEGIRPVRQLCSYLSLDTVMENDRHAPHYFMITLILILILARAVWQGTLCIFAIQALDSSLTRESMMHICKITLRTLSRKPTTLGGRHSLFSSY